MLEEKLADLRPLSFDKKKTKTCNSSNLLRLSITRDLQRKNSLDKTLKFWWMPIISASLPTVCIAMQNLSEKLSETLQWPTRKNNHNDFTFGM